MTFKKFLGLGLLFVVILTFLKIIYGEFFNEESNYVQYFFWVVTAVFTIAFTRRLGVINYLESFVIIGVWSFFTLIFDNYITSRFVPELFYSWHFWMHYIIVAVSIFLFHKKRHVEIRRQIIAKKQEQKQQGHH